jgi:hypothetical protein
VRGAPPRTTQPRVGNPPPPPRPAAGACRGRCRPDHSPAGARSTAPVATDCAARCGSSGSHSGLRTGRIAGLLGHPMGRTPSARLPRGEGSSGPAAPRRDRRGRRTLRGPADPPRSGVRAGARTATRVQFASRAAGRGSWAGRRAGPIFEIALARSLRLPLLIFRASARSVDLSIFEIALAYFQGKRSICGSVRHCFELLSASLNLYNQVSALQSPAFLCASFVRVYPLWVFLPLALPLNRFWDGPCSSASDLDGPLGLLRLDH